MLICRNAEGVHMVRERLGTRDLNVSETFHKMFKNVFRLLGWLLKS